MKKKLPTAAFFRAVTTERQAYLLGFITADGNLTKNGYYLRIILGLKDVAFLETVRDLLAPSNQVKRFTRLIHGRRGSFCELVIGCREMVTDLKAHGLTPAKSLTAKPWQGERKLMRHYWRGVFDGDGSLFPNGNNFGLNLVGTQEIVRAFANFADLPSRPYKTGNIWLVATKRLLDVQRVCALLYYKASIFLPRKAELAEKIICHSPLIRDWGELTADDLLELYEKKGNWKSVADYLGLRTSNYIYKICKRLGVPIVPAG